MKKVEIRQDGSVTVTRKDTLVVDWHKANFMRMTENYKRIRAKHRQKLDRCFVCNWPFQIGTEDNGEIINIVSFKGKGNKVLCTDCYNELTSKL